MKEGSATTSVVPPLHRDSVVFEDLDRRPGGFGLAVFNKASGKENHPLRVRCVALPLGQNLRKGPGLVLGHRPAPVDARGFLHQQPHRPILESQIGDGCGETRHLPHSVLLRPNAIHYGQAFFLGLNQLGPGHELGEIQGPLVRGVVRTVVVTELALITEVHDFLALGRGQLRGLLVVSVNRLEERGKRGAKGKTPSTVLAFFEDTRHFFVEGTPIEKFRIRERRVLHQLAWKPFNSTRRPVGPPESRKTRGSGEERTIEGVDPVRPGRK